ncbi:MAG: hypothetical protein JWN04_5044 [Myxococcaceae bacterium]|nr:hypothetical protein [Myxococcaceae bacterium]
MKQTILLAWLALSLSLQTSCGDTGRERVSVALSAQGTAARPVQIADATVTLTRADLALGPLYFCASQIGRAELCDVAVAELLEVVPIVALNPAPQPLGVLNATTGSIMSAIYDFGISWLLTENKATPSPQSIAGHSAIFEGTIVRAGKTLRFSAAIDAEPRVRGDLTVNAQRTSHEIVGQGEQVTLQIDANTWIDRLQIDALFALDSDGDGSVAIEPGTQSYESIYQGMLNRTPLSFAWTD